MHKKQPENKLTIDSRPIDILLEDNSRFLHELSQFFMIADPKLKPELIISTIAFAAGTIVNRNTHFRSFLMQMPDEHSKNLLVDLLFKMEKLADSIFRRPREEMRSLITQREEFCTLIDEIIISHHSLINHLKSLQTPP
ncbi:MAG: hypothetical protein PHT40_03795 [Patescibacteria group bacterium]|nr:hypothetical protein [Patescibacteria group bacterium]